jgi:hypothetical protein
MDGDTMLGHMSPVVHHKDWNLIRVPLRKIGDKYDVFVSDDLVRHYDERTLPDVLKSKMAMILASPQPNLIPDERLQKLNVYSVTMPELALVGWRVSETWFCLALDRLTLNSLKGGTLTKEKEDA